MARFRLVGSRHVFCDEKHVCTIKNEEKIYGPPLLRKLNSYEGKEKALLVLVKLFDDPIMKRILRGPTLSDQTMIKSYLTPSGVTDPKYGTKHICHKCNQKFFDLNGRVNSCPGCKTSISD